MAQNNRDSAIMTRGDNRLPAPTTWAEMRDQASVLVKSGFLPTSVKTPEAAIAIMMTGSDFGFTPMQSFRMIHVIEGKPCLSADAMSAVVNQWCRNIGGDAYLKVTETTNDRCTVRFKRPESGAKDFTFTIDDAKRAELLGKQNWKKYPAAMLRARAITGAARMGFPDVVAGVYDPEELDREPIHYTPDDDSTVVMVSGNVVNHESGEILASLDDVDDRERVNRDMHGWMASIGRDHDDIHNAAVELSKGKFNSLGDMDQRDLRNLCEALQKAHHKSAPDFTVWLDGLRAKYPATDVQVEIVDDSESQETTAPIIEPPMTSKQHGLIQVLAKDLHLTAKDLDELGNAPLALLSQREASQLIEELQTQQYGRSQGELIAAGSGGFDQ